MNKIRFHKVLNRKP